MDPMIVLAYIAILLMIGVLCTFVSRMLRLPYNLILLLLGLFLGSLFVSGSPLVQIDSGFIVAIGTLMLVLLVFDSAARMRVDEVSPDALPSIRLMDLFVIFSIVIVSSVTAWLFFPAFTLSAILFSLIFAVLMVETDLGEVLHLFKDFAKERAKHILKFLETEADLNTAFVIIFPFIVLSLIHNSDFENRSLLDAILFNLPSFLYEILIAIGMGIIVGLIVLRVMQRWYDKHLSPIALVAAALVGYIFTNMLGGNGIIAVAVMGFFFGNIYVSGKEQLVEFGRMLSGSLEIMVFILLGLAVRLPVSASYVFKSLLIFAVILGVRSLASFIALRHQPFTKREKAFIGLNMPKGVALATVLLMLSTYSIFELDVVLQLSLMVMIYSIAWSYLLDFYAVRFLHEEVALQGSSPVSRLKVLEMRLDVPAKAPSGSRKPKAKKLSGKRKPKNVAKRKKPIAVKARKAKPKKRSVSRPKPSKKRSKKRR
ncbi:cation:proton antiporter [Candidatus Woesearchaeota archaeon]|nr:cation:proton antiporter [Candidatus Woesearchaeota archaeon]